MTQKQGVEEQESDRKSPACYRGLNNAELGLELTNPGLCSPEAFLPEASSDNLRLGNPDDKSGQKVRGM